MLIHLNCPSCSEHHAIPDNFAGGVFRCQKCGTLMSVPKTSEVHSSADPNARNALMPEPEPEPDFTTARAAAPASRSASGSGRASSGATKSSARLQPNSASHRAGQRRSDSQSESAPPKSNSWLIPVIGLAILVIILGVAVAVKLGRGSGTTAMPPVGTSTGTPTSGNGTSGGNAAPGTTTGTGTTPQKPPVAEEAWAFTYNAADNPMTIGKPNVLGLPLQTSTTVVLDGCQQLDGIRTSLHKLLAAGLSNKDFPIRAQIIYANSASDYAESSAKTVKDITAEELQEFLTSKSPTALATPGYVRAAGQAGNLSETTAQRHIILVLGHTLTPVESANIIDRLDGRKKYIRLDIVAVGDVQVPAELQSLCAQSWTKGRVISLSPDQLSTWAP